MVGYTPKKEESIASKSKLDAVHAMMDERTSQQEKEE